MGLPGQPLPVVSSFNSKKPLTSLYDMAAQIDKMSHALDIKLTLMKRHCFDIY